MATDIETVLRNIESCYDFTGRSVIHVGAGGGQSVRCAGRARRVLGVDHDSAAVKRLEQAIREQGLEDRFRAVRGDILAVRERADVVFFEFCLHEIVDPRAALRHARNLAPETLVVDPAVDSRWAWIVCETEKAQRGWAAVERYQLALDRTFPGVQRFRDQTELLTRVEGLGDCALRRASEYAGQRDFSIDMPYRVALMSR